MFAAFTPSMSLHKFIYAGLLFIMAAIIMVCDTGCANIIPPTGGPRDSLPPVLISATPVDSALKFTGKRITLTFDEYVQLENQTENVIVSPTPAANVGIDYKLRTVTVRINDTLEANTTYSINFGNAIKDINEGNVLKQFTYVFSTGSFLDDRVLTGKITIAETGKTDSTLLVMLYREADDSSIIKKRPRYITRLDNKGNFTFRNLPSGTFYLYAVKGANGSRRYVSKSELFAFAGKPVLVTEKNDPVELYAYVEKAEEVKKPATSIQGGSTKDKKNEDKRLRYQTNLESGQQDILDSLEIRFATPLRLFDSTKMVLTDEKYGPVGKYSFIHDSLLQKFTLLFPWKPATSYTLVLSKEVAEDSTGKKLTKNDTLNFKTRKLEDYGNLLLKFPALDLSKHPVLQFIQSDKIVYTYPFVNQQFSIKLFKPGDYELRILYDENGNNRWDAGEFFGKHRQPEKVRQIDLKLTVKANWENEHTISL